MIRVAIFVGLGALLAGCSAPYPDYRVASVVQDTSLIGTWRVAEEGGEEDRGAGAADSERERDAGRAAAGDEGEPEGKGRFVQFEGRPVAVHEGRLSAERGGTSSFEGSSDVVVQYTVRYTEDGKQQVFAGYLLKVGALELLALQYDGEEMSELGGLVLPVHQYFKIEHEADEIELWGAEKGVAWLPQFEPADGPEDPAAPIPVRDAPPGVRRLSGSVDRVLAYYAAHAADPGFWSDERVVLRRVDEKGEEEEND